MNIFEKELTSDFDKTFYKNLCERFSKEELAGMYTLATKREQELKQKLKKLKEADKAEINELLASKGIEVLQEEFKRRIEKLQAENQMLKKSNRKGVKK